MNHSEAKANTSVYSHTEASTSSGANTSVSAPSAQINEGSEPIRPHTTPMPSSFQRRSCMMKRRSCGVACRARVSKEKTRAASQPHTKGGITTASGGTNHNGRLKASTPTASTVHPSDHRALAHHPAAPPRRSRPAKRRCATQSTNAGVTVQATSSSASTTISGTVSATTISGASTARNAPPPMASSQVSSEATRAHSSRKLRTAATAGSQNNQPRVRAVPADSSKGISDHRITRGCKQPSTARQKASSKSFMGGGSYARGAKKRTFRLGSVRGEPFGCAQDERRYAAQARPTSRFRPSHCCAQKPWP